MIDFTFVNGSAPYLNAENLNSIVGSINDNESSISVLEDIVDDLTHEIVPESIVKEAVDDYVEEHSGGFATETELQSLNESLMNLEYAENGGKNLLECTLSTTTKNGITCERLSDGTYKLNGTLNGADAYFDIGSASVEIGKQYKHFGFSNPNKSTIASYIQNSDGTHTHWETDNDGIITAQSSNYNMVIRVNGNGTVCNNLIFKPMISEDTSITFSDYVPYIKSVRGLTESLTNLIKTFTQNVSSNSNGTIYTAPINGIIVDCSTVQRYSVVHVKDNMFVLCDNSGTSFDTCPNVTVDIVIKYI